MSGGVDSSVTALLLKQQGHEVIGATMAIWGDRNIKGIAQDHKKKNACFGPDEKEDIESAKKVAAEIGVPYHVFNCAKEYDEVVLKYFKSSHFKKLLFISVLLITALLVSESLIRIFNFIYPSSSFAW